MNATIDMPTEAGMRDAIARRDADYDGRFLYGVITTGVFCYPSCAARPARPENLRFFPDRDTALAADFRPCKRCRPDKALSRQDRMVQVARYIELQCGQTLTLADLGKRFDLSPSNLQRQFKKALGMSPREYQDSVRTRRFRSLLKEGDAISGATYEAGFGSTSRIYSDAARHVGMTPGAYRAGGTGETIFFACRETVLGPMLMAATERGICFAQFGEDDQQLLEKLRMEYPHAELIESAASKGPELDAWIAALNEHISSRAPRPTLPLDLRGTAFQIRVWKFLLSIREGDVVSYSEVASGIGRPKAVRAAASACGANNVAVLVPCHRVLRGDGSIGGYRWGVVRKRVLLDAERERRANS